MLSKRSFLEGLLAALALLPIVGLEDVEAQPPPRRGSGSRPSRPGSGTRPGSGNRPGNRPSNRPSNRPDTRPNRPGTRPSRPIDRRRPNRRPPPLRRERVPRARSGYIWVPGYWAWSERRRDYVWVPGTWIRARPGRRWRGPRWTLRAGDWVFEAGRWF